VLMILNMLIGNGFRVGGVVADIVLPINRLLISFQNCDGSKDVSALKSHCLPKLKVIDQALGSQAIYSMACKQLQNKSVLVGSMPN